MYEVAEVGLSAFPVWTAAETTELARSGPKRYLAFWRLSPRDAGAEDPVWEHILRAAAPNPACLYVPAFSLVRPVVQRLGVRLTEVQPLVELAAGGPVALGRRPVLVETGSTGVQPEVVSSSSPAGMPPGRAPDFDIVSPVLIGRREAWGLAHFVYLAIEAREARDLQAAEIDLEPGLEELVFFPAVWDPRYIHESNWRLLLREFDGLVA